MALKGDINSTGCPVPPERHAIVCSLPSWRVNVHYPRGDMEVLGLMQTSYPRFYIHKFVRKLILHLQHLHATSTERALVFTSSLAVEACVSFLVQRGVSSLRIRNLSATCSSSRTLVELHVIIFPSDAWRIAKLFWMHTGMGISSRCAAHYLDLLGIGTGELLTGVDDPSESIPDTGGRLSQAEDVLSRSVAAKHAIRGRIGQMVGVDTSDVFLYPTGMTAIWSAHQLLMRVFGDDKKSVCFGFPYVDTLKVLEKWGAGCHFFPNGRDESVDDLEELLLSLYSYATGTTTSQQSRQAQPILALFTELPSNPLLVSVNLPRLRQLADRFGFVIVVDDTVGNFANVDALRYADVVVNSLSKLFSGRANVLGGSVILNRKSPHYEPLHARLTQTFVDTYFPLDALVMEENSSDFIERNKITNANAEWLGEKLLEAAKKEGSIVKDVYYPKWKTRENYDTARRPDGGFGPILTILFSSVVTSSAFFDALPFAKGPSLGTNFTLVFAYTIVAHYGELEWASKHGVKEEMIRVSVGMETREELWYGFEKAIEAAKAFEERLSIGRLGANGVQDEIVRLTVAGNESRADKSNVDPASLLYWE